MPTTCGIVNCSARHGRDNTRFFRLPIVITSQGEQTKEKSERRRRLWLSAINRSEFGEKTLDYLRVCSEHFISGNPSSLYDETNPDWIPSLNLGYGTSTDPGHRYARLQNRTEIKQKKEAAMTLIDLSSSLVEGVALQDLTSITEEITDLTDSEKLELATAEISDLKVENQKLRDEVTCLKKLVFKLKSNEPEDFENDDNKVKYFTGLSSYVILMALFNLLKPEISDSKLSSLTRFQKVIITLMRLRLNLSVTDLSYRFGVSATTVSKVFLDTIHIMYVRLQPLVRWPERDELYETMPMVFRKYFGHKITVIIDCFEIFIDRPSNMTARAQTWSNYKHHNTAKYLIGITPQGSISFISEGWGGRVSDKHLTANSKFISHLIHGDVILADRGFEIQELVAVAGAEVKYPAFMRGKTQLTATEVESTRKIANVRIHVERVIGCVRQKFTILGATCPIDHIITRNDSSCPVLDKVVFVCCALTNMCPSVVPFE